MIVNAPRLTGSMLIMELRGTRCRCGSYKESRKTFCGPCYRALPPMLQSGLYLKIGDGYEEVYESAAQYLDANGRSASRPRRALWSCKACGRIGEVNEDVARTSDLLCSVRAEHADKSARCENTLMTVTAPPTRASDYFVRFEPPAAESRAA